MQDADRTGQELFERVDMQDYHRYTFNMYGGKVELVTLQFLNRMMGAAIDRFRRDIVVSKADDYHFRITVPVAVSPQFFAWIFGLGNTVSIVEPEHVKEKMKDMLKKASERYE